MAHYYDHDWPSEEERQRARAQRAEEQVRDLQQKLKETTDERDALRRLFNLFNQTKEKP